MVSGFLKSTSHNLRYVGIDSLARIVRINAKYAVEHQLAVIDCLEDPDDTLKKKTLELLYKMTKPGNVEVTAPCMLSADNCQPENCISSQSVTTHFHAKSGLIRCLTVIRNVSARAQHDT